MNRINTTYCLLLLFLSFATTKLCAADYYQLTDPVFINYLKTTNAELVTDDDQLVIAQVPSVNIQSINLSNTGLSNVDGIQFFTNVQNIDISSNQIDSVPDLNSLAQLKTIDASGNNLTSFDVVSQLKSLEELDLSDNLISSFPAFDENNGLTNLDFSSNKLIEITNFTKANALRVLDISNNWIKTLQAFDILNFPVLTELNIKNNRLYYDDYDQLPSVAINKEIQRAIVLTVPDTIYLGDTLKIDLSYDSHPSNFHVLINQPELFELADTYTSLLTWPITDTSQTGTYFIQTSNSTYTSHVFLTNEFSFVVTERPVEEPIDTTIDEPIEKPIEEPEEPDGTNGSVDLDYQLELIPDGSVEEQSIYLKGEGEAVVFTKSGSVYNRFSLPYKWDGSNTNGEIVPGYYLIKLGDNQLVKITVVY